MNTEMVTTRDVADAYGVSIRRINQIANKRGIEPRKAGHVNLWTARQARLLKPERSSHLSKKIGGAR